MNQKAFNILLLILIGLLLIYNVFQRSEQTKQSISEKEIQEFYEGIEKRFAKFELQIKIIDHEIYKDSAFVSTATADQLDSLERIYNPAR